MKRFILSDAALADMDGIIDYIRSLPTAPGIVLGRELRETLESIADHPGLGAVDQELSAMFERPIHRRVCRNYFFFYASDKRYAEVIAVLHGKQNWGEILKTRVS